MGWARGRQPAAAALADLFVRRGHPTSMSLRCPRSRTPAGPLIVWAGRRAANQRLRRRARGPIQAHGEVPSHRKSSGPTTPCLRHGVPAPCAPRKARPHCMRNGAAHPVGLNNVCPRHTGRKAGAGRRSVVAPNHGAPGAQAARGTRGAASAPEGVQKSFLGRTRRRTHNSPLLVQTSASPEDLFANSVSTNRRALPFN